MDKDYQVTVDSLVKNELDGKANAIARYDDMLWKIRSGYAVILYASIGLVAGLVNEETIDLNRTTALSISVLIFGFSAFAAFLDYSFMRSKLRVVSYRDRLTELAYKRANGEKMDNENKPKDKEKNELLECLKNSGERREDINWSRWTGFWRPPILYGGTCLVCVAAATILAK
jgi:hypothetical protein